MKSNSPGHTKGKRGESEVIIRGAKWFDSKRMIFIDGKELWVEDGIIKDIGFGWDRPGRDVVDLQGMVLLPGWIDAHLHLTLTGEADPISRWKQNGVIFTAIQSAVSFLHQHLRAGVTVVRDLGGGGDVVLHLKKAVSHGIIDGPEIFTSGQALTMTGGHIYQISKEVDGPDMVRRGAREELKKGVDLIKVIATGGILTSGVSPGSPQLAEEEIRVAVEEAHKAGRRVASHAEGQIGILNSLRAGVDTLEHGIGLNKDAVAMMCERGVILVPTLAAPRLILRHRDELPNEMVQKAEKIVEEHRVSFALARKHGCMVALGTDAGTPFNQHGAIHLEFAELIESGMKQAEILQAVSLHGAMALGIDDRLGNIEPEKEATFTLIDDRLSEADWYRNVRLIIQKGKITQI